MSLILTFEIELQSDYHIGAGYGAGTEIDSALFRDVDGAYAIRGTTITGLLRDALRDLLSTQPLAKRGYSICQESGADAPAPAYCGATPDSAGNACPLCRVFGTPRDVKHWAISSARPKSEDVPVTEDPPVGTMRVRVDPRTRRAGPRQLFSEEQGTPTVFTFTATCSGESPADLDEAALLVAAARFVRGLGGSRRRGEGQCLFRLTDVAATADDPHSQADLLQRFRDHFVDGTPHTPSAGGQVFAAPEPDSEAEPHGKPFRVRVVAVAEEPVVIARRAAAGNRFEGQEAISGTALRGALASRAASSFDLNDDATYDAFLGIFLHGKVRFPALYPAAKRKGEDGSCDWVDAIPTPRDAFACKVFGNLHAVQWGTQDGVARMCSEKGCKSAVKRSRDKWIPVEEGITRLKARRRSEMHVTINPETNRAAEGQLFEYRALESRQTFTGELVCADAAAWESFKTLTGIPNTGALTLRLGKGRQRGYGKMLLTFEPIETDAPPIGVPIPIEARLETGIGALTVTLLSDTIIRDPFGRFETGFADRWLRKALNLDLRVDAERAFADIAIIDGFNDTKHLPRTRATAITAGSTVRIVLTKPLTDKQRKSLKALEIEGIGERRVEGYGRIAFNHPIYKRCHLLPRNADQDGADHTEKQPTFIDLWLQRLDDEGNWHDCRDQAFGAIARWLAVRRYRTLDETLMDLGKFGHLDSALAELLGGPAEVGDRVGKGSLEDGIHVIRQHLEALKTETNELWPTGIDLLAQRLAAEADRKENR